MTSVLVALMLALGAPPQVDRVPTEAIKTPAALAERFEVLSRFSFVANRLGTSFTVDAGGRVLYFPEGRLSENIFDLMAIPIAGGVPHAVVALCGPDSPFPGNAYCEDNYFRLGSIPRQTSRLVVAVGQVERCCTGLYLLDLTARTAKAMNLGVSPRHALLREHGISPDFKAVPVSAAPSGKYLLANLWVYEPSGLYDEEYFGIFSLETGRREFIYRRPTELGPHEAWDAEGKTRVVVGQAEAQVGWWDAWWEPSDILVLRHRGGSGEKILGAQAFEREETGIWRPVTLASYERRKGWPHTPSEDSAVGNYALVGRDPNGQGGYVIDGSVLFAAGAGGIYVIEFDGKAIVLKVRRSGIEGRVEGIVLKPRPAPAVS